MEESSGIVGQICATRRSFERLKENFAGDTSFANSVDSALMAFPDEKEIEDDYRKNADNERLLKIGIVGAVKAGKSSLLNSLFFEGKDILPKAATPMTAALTEITWGDKCEVTVDFFTDDDIARLKRQSDEYLRQKEDLVAAKTEKMEENWCRLQKRRDPSFEGDPGASDRNKWAEQSEKAAAIELKQNVILSGAYEQYQMIRKSSSSRKKGSDSFSCESPRDISGLLEDYVGSKGKFMPFTSKVSIKLPLDSLKGISVVDTPGFNDPVPSRDDRARKSLHECDVIFILSRAEHCLAETDMDAIDKIRNKEGILEIYIVPSQADSALLGNLAEDSGGDIDEALEMLQEQLGGQVSEILSQKNASGVFDSLIEDASERMFLTSGICESMATTFDDRDEWDDEKNTVWQNLCEYYPDDFSDSEEDTSMASLRKLGNISKIRECIDRVKEKKADIFSQRLAEFGGKYARIAQDVQKRIGNELDVREENFRKQNVGRLDDEIKQLQESYDMLAPRLDESLHAIVDGWYNETKSRYESDLSSRKDRAEAAVNNSERSDIPEEYTTGLLFWKKTHTRYVRGVNVYDVKNSIEDYINAYNQNLPHYFSSRFDSLVSKVVTRSLEIWSENNTAFSDSAAEFRNLVSKVMSGISRKPDLEYHGSFSYSSCPSNLTGSDAQDCLASARNFVSSLNRQFSSMLYGAIQEVSEGCRNCQFSSNVLSSCLKLLGEKKAEKENSQRTLEMLKKMKEEVRAIKC